MIREIFLEVDFFEVDSALRTSLRLDQHSKEHWPGGGGVNKDDPWARENPREKGLGGKW